MGIGDNSPQQGYCLYVHQNPENLKMYIGITNNVKRRWAKKAESYKHCPKIYCAFKKYGWDYFNHIVLFDGMTKEEACEKEKAWINAAKLADKTYNLADGGKGVSGVIYSEERRRIIREKLTGRPCSEETRRKISIATKGKKAKKIFAFDPKTRKLIAEYPSIRAAAAALNIHHTNISSVAKYKKAIAGGYIWSYSLNVDFSHPIFNTLRDTTVYCYDLQGNYVCEYSSAAEAAKAVGGLACPIGECCSKNKLTYKGYIWRRDKERIDANTLNRIKLRPRKR